MDDIFNNGFEMPAHIDMPEPKNYAKMIEENNTILKQLVPLFQQQSSLLETLIKQNSELIDELVMLKKPSNN